MEELLIVFDTNVVNRLSPSSPRADLIHALRSSGHHRVGVPQMVLEEMVAHQAKRYYKAHLAAAEALGALEAETPWTPESVLADFDLERCQEHWRAAYADIFEVIATSGEAAFKGLAREAMALPPAKDSKPVTGGRDAAIWFSVLEFMDENPDEGVFFVTGNHRDFGDGSAFAYPMNEDLEGKEDRFTLLPDFDSVVQRFTKAVPGEDAAAAAAELLSSDPYLGEISTAAFELEAPASFVGIGPSGEPVTWSSWALLPNVELLSVANVTGHEIEGDTWYTAEAQWLLSGVVHSAADAESCAASVWQIKVLLTTGTDRDGSAPTLLAAQDPALPRAEDEERCIAVVRRVRESVRRLGGQAQQLVLPDVTRSLRPLLTSLESSVTRQLADSLPKFTLPPSLTRIPHPYSGAQIAKILANSHPAYDTSWITKAALRSLAPTTGPTARLKQTDDVAENHESDEQDEHGGEAE
ncbi:DUF4935 domain-containing protein [Streptomyces sp. SID14478]|uniref:PIN domain-containing protein n=1 Tax=Streptomyces sp. SID14478 TaxID=2706073 RepID=UPI0013DC1F74|nr:PIN domain-containing protein [Streptomyces sp. SID14478]NEB79008.1 DUF4935 domain-containing protein [Streptomyces sp. SID14478]